MRKNVQFFKTIAIGALIFALYALPICASAEYEVRGIEPRYNNVGGVSLTIGFDTNDVVYVTLSAATYSHGSGVSGVIKLFDSDGNCLDVWSVSDYVEPIFSEVSYQGEYGETYTATFGGYAYSNNGTPADRLDLSVTGTCKD